MRESQVGFDACGERARENKHNKKDGGEERQLLFSSGRRGKKKTGWVVERTTKS